MIIAGIGQGLLWAGLAIGVFLTYRILDIPDLTAEGSFPLGAAITISMLTQGHNVITATLAGFLAGCLAGVVTGILDTIFHIPSLLAGILTMTGLYSVNIHIMGRANIALTTEKVLTNYLPANWDLNWQTVIIGFLIDIAIVAVLWWYFQTNNGLALTTVGNNPVMSAANGISVNAMTIIGYAISNGLIALSGSLVAQSNGFADIGMGVGTIVIGLASVLVGEIFLRSRKMWLRLSAMVVGAVVYRLLLTIAMSWGINPNDLKIMSAFILVVVIVLPLWQAKLSHHRQLQKYFHQLEEGNTHE